MRISSIAILACALGGCDTVSDLLGVSATVEGRVVDSKGEPVEGAQIRVYNFTTNLDAFNAPGDEVALTDPGTYNARVAVGRLSREGEVTTTAVTGADGRYRIESLPVDGVIITADHDAYSTDIKGMDRQTGTVSLASAIKPTSVDVSERAIALRADFVIAGGPIEVEDDDGGASEQVDPVPPNEDELVEPTQEPTWTQFVVEDVDGNVIADASSGNGTISGDHLLVTDGAEVRIRATHSDTSLAKALLRVQIGAGGCGDEAPDPQIHQIQLELVDGELSSDEGPFQPLWLSGGVRLQLDIDGEPDTGDESYLIGADATCAPPASALEIELLWNVESVDVDLHVWDEDQEQTWHGSYYDGEYGGSSYGRVTLADRLGFGPEVFVRNPDESGLYTVRAHVFCGPPVPVTMHAIVRRRHEGEWQTENYTAVMEPGADWVDIGVFPAD